MKNILVLKHYKLKKTTGWCNQQNIITNEDFKNKIEKYNQMKQWCIESAYKCIIGLDDIIIHDTIVEDIQDAFQQHFYDLYKLWKTKKFNILYSDLDVLFIKKLNWFDVSKKFIMYNSANSGVRYHGHDMDETLWQHAFKLVKKWNSLKWDFEQDIYKEMYSLPINKNHIRPNLVLNLPQYDDPKKLYERCFIYHDSLFKNYAVHFHTTHGDKQFTRMKNMYYFLKTINF